MNGCLFTRRRFLAGSLALGLVAMRPLRADEGCRKIRGLAILVDYPGTLRSVSKEQVVERFDRLDRFVREMSYGKVCAEFDFTEWHSMPVRISDYAISPINLQIDKSRERAFKTTARGQVVPNGVAIFKRYLLIENRQANRRLRSRSAGARRIDHEGKRRCCRMPFRQITGEADGRQPGAQIPPWGGFRDSRAG
jgi:hypothetical protein